MTTPLEKLSTLVPAVVREVCETLQRHGHRALAVGGAVRDAMLGRNPGDWDVTTSALPDDVMALFRKTIPTGIEHGTVTVMLGRGADRMGIEVTTFRGEGAYSDSRRPDHVTFGVSLEEDLARRDFVINAMAYDPVSALLEDPFGGAADIEKGLVRAVGDPVQRFAEDGLRIMRAVRFVSVLGFALDPGTEEALEAALPSLAKVAAERVRVELIKLLKGEGAAHALDIAHERGVLATAVPLFSSIGDWDKALARALVIERTDPVLRLAALVYDCEQGEIERAMRALTLTNQEHARIATVCRLGRDVGDVTDAELRALLGSAKRERAGDLATMWLAAGETNLGERARAILTAGDPLVAADLAIGGKDIMSILGIGPSRAIGELLDHALSAVHRDPAANTVENLTNLIRAAHESKPPDRR